MHLLFATLCLVSAASAKEDSSSKPVYFSFIYSGGGPGGFNSSGVIPAVDIALEEIQRNNLLPGYNLTYDEPVDSKVTPSATNSHVSS